MFTINVSMHWFYWVVLSLAFSCQTDSPAQQSSEATATQPPLFSQRTEDQVEAFLANAPATDSQGPIPGLRVRTSERFRSGDLLAAMIASCVALCLMAPGMYVFYCSIQGLSLNLDGLGKGVSLLCLLALAWVLLFYSLAFSRNAHSYDVLAQEIEVMDRESAPGNLYIGELRNSALSGLGSEWGGGKVRHPLRRVDDRIPHMLFMTLQMMIYLQSVVPLLVVAGKGIGVWPTIPFWLLWSASIYVPLCYWTQGGGWLAECIDASGAVQVHIGIGFTALGLWWIKTPSISLSECTAQSTGLVTGWFLWVTGLLLLAACRSSILHAGWTPDVLNYFLAGCAGHLTWVAFQYKSTSPKVDFLWLFGSIAGIVAIASGSGSVSPGSAIIIGFSGAAAARVAFMSHRYESINMLWIVFAIQGVSAMVGLVMTGIFASANVAGDNLAGKAIFGLLGGNMEQLRVQLLTASISAILACVFGVVSLRVASVLGSILKRLFEEAKVHELAQGQD